MKKRVLKIVYWFFGILTSLMLIISLLLYIYKDDIIQMVVAQVNPYLNTEVEVKEIDLTFWSTFPKVSVDFNNVFVKDALENALATDTLLQTERIRLKFNPIDLWNENYHVEKIEIAPGTFQMKVDSSGKVNYKILKEVKDTASAPFNFKLESVSLDGIRFSYVNEKAQQTYATKINHLNLIGDFSASAYTLQSDADLVMYKAQSGQVALLKNKHLKLNTLIEINTEKSTFDLRETQLKVENIPLKTVGHVYPNDVDFQIQTQNLALTDFIHHFAMKEMDEVKKIQGTGTVDFNLSIKDELKEDSFTKIDCQFKVSNGSLIEPSSGLKIANIEVDGAYHKMNGPNSDELAFRKFKFRTKTGPFDGHLKVTHFLSPLYEGKAKGNIDLKALHSIFKISTIDKVAGNINVFTNFKIKTYPKARMDKLQKSFELQRLEGQVEMHHVDFKMQDDKRTFSNIEGLLYLKQNEAGINDVSLNLDASDLKVNGVFQNLQAYLNGTGNLNANVELKSNKVRIEDLSSSSKAEKIQSDRAYILPSDISGQVFVHLGVLTYAGHQFEAIEGNLYVGNRLLNFPSIHLKNAEAAIQGALRIEERNPEVFNLQMMASSDNIQFKPLFKEWDNFKQEVILSDNISGNASVKMSMEAPFDLRSGIQMNDIRSQVYMKVDNGRLRNVKAFESIIQSIKESSVRMFIGKRNVSILEQKLKDLKFETLENTFYIKNSVLEIPKMEIKSSLIDIDLAGSHSFANDIDYKFAFRFRDLKTQEKDSEFGEIVDDGTGVNIFMRMYGNLSNPKIEWDKKAKKEHAKENREKEKADIKAIFKSEFGLFKNDTTVKSFQPKEGPKETLEIEFGPGKEENPLDIQKPKKNNKLKEKLDKLKKQSEEDKKETIEFEP